jgi:RimJ/RimL family protein N-acetyltransferase
MRLREVTDDDLDELYAQQADRVSYEMAHVPTRDRPAFDAHWQMLRTNPETLLRVIDVDGAVAGSVLSFVLHGERMIGYWIGREFWGRGIATQALAQMLAIETRRPLRADVFRPNRASARVLAKNGFRLLAEQPDSLTFELR